MNAKASENAAHSVGSEFSEIESLAMVSFELRVELGYFRVIDFSSGYSGTRISVAFLQSFAGEIREYLDQYLYITEINQFFNEIRLLYVLEIVWKMHSSTWG